jgi:hypothetical protein
MSKTSLPFVDGPAAVRASPRGAIGAVDLGEVLADERDERGPTGLHELIASST